MKAILVHTPGDATRLVMDTYPTPEPGHHDVRVRVEATALNRADLLQRQGLYPPPEGASPLLGLEVAGVVDRVGAAVSKHRPGDRIFGLLPGGGYAAYAVLPEVLALPIPPSLSFVEAAAVPEVFLTAYQALYHLGELRPGQYVLIHAGGSGVGTAAIQLVREAGAFAVTTSSGKKTRACLNLGAVGAIDYEREDFVARVSELTQGHGADLILDFIGGPYLERNVQCLARDGRIIVLALMGGRTAAAFDLLPLFRKRGSLITSTLRNRTLDEKAALTRDFDRDVLPLLAEGRIRPVIDRVFDWTEVVAAHQYMEANRNVGKIVLRVSEDA